MRQLNVPKCRQLCGCVTVKAISKIRDVALKCQLTQQLHRSSHIWLRGELTQENNKENEALRNIKVCVFVNKQVEKILNFLYGCVDQQQIRRQRI